MCLAAPGSWIKWVLMSFYSDEMQIKIKTIAALRMPTDTLEEVFPQTIVFSKRVLIFVYRLLESFYD